MQTKEIVLRLKEACGYVAGGDQHELVVWLTKLASELAIPVTFALGDRALFVGEDNPLNADGSEDDEGDGIDPGAECLIVEIKFEPMCGILYRTDRGGWYEGEDFELIERCTPQSLGGLVVANEEGDIADDSDGDDA